MVINLLLFACIATLFFVISMFSPPDSPWAPWTRTNRRIGRAMCKIADVEEGDVVYDLGSGDGSALLTASEEYGANAIGIEIDSSRVTIARVRAFFLKDKNVNFIKSNFFNIDLSNASVIFVNLLPKALLRLKFKFAKELKPGTRIVSFRYEIPYLPLEKKDSLHQLYFYKVPESFVN